MDGSADVGQPYRPSAYQKIGYNCYTQLNQLGNNFRRVIQKKVEMSHCYITCSL